MKLSNKFIIIVPVYNAKDLIESCLFSLFSQNYKDLGIIIRDDMSTDGTDVIIKNLLGVNEDSVITRYEDKDVIFIRNTEKMFPIGNTYDSVMNYVVNDDAIIGVVDGDDSLLSSNAVTKVANVYESNDKWMVWSQHKKSSTNGVGQSNPLPSDSIIYSSRNYWSVTHFRTSKAKLFHRLNPEDLKDPFTGGKYSSYAGDAAFLYPFCEMCGNDKAYFINESLYLYNDTLPTNEHNKNVSEAVKYGMFIKTQGKRYQKLLTL